MKKLLYNICIVSSLLSPDIVTAQKVPVQLVQQLDGTLDSMKQVTGAMALSAAIQFNDGAIWEHAKGISSVVPPQDVTPNDAFLIGSVTKTITAAYILQLMDDGLLNLDDSLHKWLDTMPYIDSNITIRQLLNHTSGIFDVLAHPHNQDSLMADMSRLWTPEELIDRFIMPPNFTPGSGWSYSNTNYFLLDMIIKKVTGNRFYTEYRNRFFTPLGLSSFATPAYEPLTTPVAHVWLDIDGDGIEDDADNFYMNYMSLNATAGAAGSYFSIPRDCSKWMRSYMRGDVLSPIAMLHAKTVVFAVGAQGGLYGLGIMKNNFLGMEAWGHGGDLAYSASSWYIPSKDASITVFTNDNSVTSWDLLPVVRELLRTYNNFQLTGIKGIENEIITSISAHPNPFTNNLKVNFQTNEPVENIEIMLSDISGRKIASKKLSHAYGSQTITLNDLNLLSAGIYFVTVKADGILIKTNRISKF